MGNRDLDDLEQLEYIREWKKRKIARKVTRKHNWRMGKFHLKLAFLHFVRMLKGDSE